MKAKLGHLWREHRLLLIGFLGASLLTFLFLIRTIVATIYFASNADRPIEPWMPIGFIAQSYHVPTEILLRAVGAPAGQSTRLRLRRVAEETGVPYDQLVEQIMAAINQSRDESPVE